MKKLLFTLAFMSVMTASLPTIAEASATTAGSSASVMKLSQTTTVEVKEDRRAEILEKYLKKHNSPMAPHAQTFVDEADRYNLDWKWVVSIAGIESYYGQMIPPYSYNGWGFGVYGNNVRRFASWEEGIHVVSQALREDYMDRNGAQNLYQIGNRYASDPNWANKVTRFMNQLEAFEAASQDTSIDLSI